MKIVKNQFNFLISDSKSFVIYQSRIYFIKKIQKTYLAAQSFQFQLQLVYNLPLLSVVNSKVFNFFLSCFKLFSQALNLFVRVTSQSRY